MRTKYKVIITAAVILILISASIYTIAAEKLPQHRKIIVTHAMRTTIGQSLNLIGYIEPNAKQEIVLSTDQKIEEVYVHEGEAVKAGDILFKLDNNDSEYRLKSEQLNLKIAQRELENLLKSEGKDKKDLTSSILQAQMQYENAVDDYKSAQIKYEQNSKLYTEGFISKEELDNSQKSLGRLEGSMKISEIQFDKVKDGLNSFSDNRQQQIDKLRSNVELIKMNIETLNSKTDLSTKSFINGKIIRCKLENGQFPAPDNTKVEIYDLSRYVINTYIKQNEAVQIKEGQKASIIIKGLEDKVYAGTVVEVEDTATLSQAGSKVPMVKIKVVIDKPDEFTKVGFETEVKVDLNMKTDVTAIDFQGVVKDHNGNEFVYLFKDNKAERKLIRTGIEQGFSVEVLEGLIPGDQYILNPPERVQDQSSFKVWSWGYELK